MDVFLVPVGSDRYELYCEVPEEPAEPLAELPPEFFKRLWSRFRPQRLKHRFSEMLAEAERERRHGRDHGQPADGWLAGVKGRTMRWVAESVAEQRLLWTLRRQESATLFYPDDLPQDAAVLVLRKQLGRDFDKHQFWLIIDSLGFILSGLLMLVPGPNVLAYYFAFRLVGHYFSLLGAKRGLKVVTWTNMSSRPLAELRMMIHMEPEQRERRVQDVAEALRLEHFVTFFQRSAMPTS